MEFKYIVHNLRKERHLTQKQLADLVGVSKSTVAMWETGQRFPSKDIMVKLSDVLDVNIDELYGNEPKKKEYITNVFNPSINKQIKENKGSGFRIQTPDRAFIEMVKQLAEELYEPRDQEEINYMLKQFSQYARASKKTRDIIDGILEMEKKEK